MEKPERPAVWARGELETRQQIDSVRVGVKRA